jgi:hypothetical protein
MNQILHIFQKDARKHWLEILIALALLVLYARRESSLWPEPPSYGYLHAGSVFFSLISGLIIPTLVLFWGFLILRAVQDETLVGDRQWWVTKPYVWWKLLLAKLLFVVVFISFPLFIVQVYLLHHAGFPILSNLWGVVRMQFAVPLVIILISFLLACLTRNLGQALVGIGLALLYLMSVVSLLSGLSSHTLQEKSKLWDTLETFLLLTPLILVPIWQFARRRTWASRGVLIGCVSASTLVSLIPGSSIDRFYPLVAETDAPAKFSISAGPQTKKPSPTGVTTETILNLPLELAGIGPRTLVVVEGMEVSADSAQESRWSSGWQGQNVYLWPENEHQTLGYGLKHQEYEKTKSKPLNLHVQLLLSEYEEVEVRALQVLPGIFHDSYLGFCRVSPTYAAVIECLRPFRDPTYTARFDEAISPCLSAEQRSKNTPPGWGPAYASVALSETSAPSAALNPVVIYQLYFNFVAVPHSADGTPERNYETVALCPGAEIQIMRPKFQRKVRVQIDLPQRRLEEFAEDVPGASGGTSYDLRSIL